MSKKLVRSTCIICFDTLESMTNKDTMAEEELEAEDDRNKYILHNFCTQFGIQEVKMSQWNFQHEPLPFCTMCQKTVMNLNLVHQRLETAKKSIICMKKNIRGTVVEHARKNLGGRQADDGRVKIIRDFILGQEGKDLEKEEYLDSSDEDPDDPPSISLYQKSMKRKTGGSTGNFKSVQVKKESQEDHDYDLISHNGSNNKRDELTMQNNCNSSSSSNTLVTKDFYNSSKRKHGHGSQLVNQHQLQAGTTRTWKPEPVDYDDDDDNDDDDEDDGSPRRKEQVKAVKLAESDEWVYSGYKFHGNNDKGYKCSCGEHSTIYKQRCDVIRHIRVRHLKNAKNHRCSICPMRYVRPARLRRHLKTVHNIIDTDIVRVGGLRGIRPTGGTRPQNNSFVRIQPPPPPKPPQFEIVCDQCHQKFSNDHQLQLHLKQVHSPPPCPSSRKFGHHNNSRSKKKRKRLGIFKCRFCDCEFNFEENLLKHVQYFHPNGQKYRNHNNDVDNDEALSNESNTTTTTTMDFDDDDDSRPLQCNKKYRRYGALSNHIVRVHNKNNKKHHHHRSRSLQVVELHVCAFCGKTYGIEDLLRKHEIECHHDDPRFLFREGKKKNGVVAAPDIDHDAETMDNDPHLEVVAAPEVEENVVATQQEQAELGSNNAEDDDDDDDDEERPMEEKNNESVMHTAGRHKWPIIPCWVQLTPLRM